MGRDHGYGEHFEEGPPVKTQELLSSLARKRPGIEMHMCKNHMATVKTLYDPFVVGVGPTLFSAALDCARWLEDVAKDNPRYREILEDVFACLKAFDTHGDLFRIGEPRES